MGQIDDKSYRDGRDAFANGTSLRTIVEQAMASASKTPITEEQAMSLGLGFLDAALDRLRGIER